MLVASVRPKVTSMYLQPVHSSGTSLYPNRGEGSPLPASFYSGRTCTKEQEHLQVPKRGDGSRLSAGFCVVRWWAAPSLVCTAFPCREATLAPFRPLMRTVHPHARGHDSAKFGLEGNSELRWTPPVSGRVPTGRGGRAAGGARFLACARSAQRNLVGFARLVALGRLVCSWPARQLGPCLAPKPVGRLEALEPRRYGSAYAASGSLASAASRPGQPIDLR